MGKDLRALSRKEHIINQLVEDEKRWFAVYTRFKCEKYVQNSLRKKGITSYTPLIKVAKEYSRSRKTYEKPLINCYVFVKINKEEYVKVLQTEYVSGFLKIGKNLIAIPEEEISILKHITGEKNIRMSERGALSEGMKVEVISGNLTGLKGVLVEQLDKKHFIVELQTIGIQLMMEISSDNLRPLEVLATA